MKKLLLMAAIALATSVNAQTEKVKVQLKHSIAASGMFVTAKDSSKGELNGELNYYIGGKDFQVGLALRSDNDWKNIAVGITTTTRIFTVSDLIKFSGLIGAGALIVNDANPKLHPAYLEVGAEFEYKIADTWQMGAYYKRWQFTNNPSPAVGLKLAHNFN